MRTLTEFGEGVVSALHLCRHGEVVPEWRGRVYGGHDVPLAPEGEQRFVELAAVLSGERFDVIVSSDLARAVHGAEQVARSTGTAHRQDARLREIDRGDWVGRPVEELQRDLPEEVARFEEDPFGYTGHGGESMHDLQERVWPVLEELADAHPGGQVFVVCHGQVIRSCVCRVLGIEDARAMRLRFDHGGITTFERFADGAWTLRRMNAAVL